LIIGDFHQVPPICDSWVFQPIDEGFKGINFWQNKINCDELCHVMRQHDTQFIEIFNKFREIYQTQQDIDIINKIYLRSPPSILEFLHLIYTNKTFR
jgi:hypothetical protein